MVSLCMTFSDLVNILALLVHKHKEKKNCFIGSSTRIDLSKIEIDLVSFSLLNANPVICNSTPYFCKFSVHIFCIRSIKLGLSLEKILLA